MVIISPILFFLFLFERLFRMYNMMALSKSERFNIITVWDDALTSLVFWLRNIVTLFFYGYGMKAAI